MFPSMCVLLFCLYFWFKLLKSAKVSNTLNYAIALSFSVISFLKIFLNLYTSLNRYLLCTARGPKRLHPQSK